MSNINANAVDALYPIAGKDNNSQGFRDNFAAIKDALAVAKTEISDIQANVLLSGALGQTELTPIENDLNTSMLKNGVHAQFYPVYSVRGTSLETNTIDLSNGPVQRYLVNNGDEFNFSWGNWPAHVNGQTLPARRCSSIRLMFKAVSGTASISFTGSVGQDDQVSGTVVPELNVTLPLVVSSTHFTVIEAWTVDEGANIYIHKIGTF